MGFTTLRNSEFFKHVHNWFIKSLFSPSTQCISTSTSLPSNFTFIWHLKRNWWTGLELCETLRSFVSVVGVSVETFESISKSCFGLFCSSPMWHSDLPSGVKLLVSSGAGFRVLGSSQIWRLRSRRFCRAWTHVFSTAVKKRLSSESLERTRLHKT